MNNSGHIPSNYTQLGKFSNTQPHKFDYNEPQREVRDVRETKEVRGVRYGTGREQVIETPKQDKFYHKVRDILHK